MKRKGKRPRGVVVTEGNRTYQGVSSEGSQSSFT
jgi:hypothetical protein